MQEIPGGQGLALRELLKIRDAILESPITRTIAFWVSSQWKLPTQNEVLKEMPERGPTDCGFLDKGPLAGPYIIVSMILQMGAIMDNLFPGNSYPLTSWP